MTATTDGTAPTTPTGAARYGVGQGESNTPILELFPGIAGVRLWAYADARTNVMVSHA